MVRKPSQMVVNSTRPPLPSEALAQISINGTMKTNAEKDIDPERDNAVSKAEVPAVTTPVRR